MKRSLSIPAVSTVAFTFGTLLIFFLSCSQLHGNTIYGNYVPGGFFTGIERAAYDPDQILALRFNSLYMSHDNGGTFSFSQHLLSHNLVDLVSDFSSNENHPNLLIIFSPLGPNDIVPERNPYILVSRDGGTIWARRSLPISPFNPEIFMDTRPVQPPVISPFSYRIMYPTYQGVLYSDNLGTSWNDFWHDGDAQLIRFHPTNENILYLAAILLEEDYQLLKTNNGGDSWNSILSLENNEVFSNLTICSSHPDTIIVTTSSRYLVTKDGGTSWRDLNGLGRKLILNADGDLLSLTYDNLFHSSDLGETWTPVFPEESPWPDFASSYGFIPDLILPYPDSPDSYFLSAFGLFFGTENSGQDWELLEGVANEGSSWLKANQDQSDVSYVMNDNSGLWRSGDRGQSWEHQWLRPISTYQISQTNPQQHIRSWNSYQDGELEAGIELSLDQGVTWEAIGEEILSAYEEINALSVAVCDNDPDHWFLSFNHHDSSQPYHTFQSHDRGQTWTGINESVGYVIPDPYNPDRIYFAECDSDLYVSEDGGDTFTLLQEGIFLNDMQFHEESGAILIHDTMEGILVSMDQGQTFIRNNIPQETASIQFIPGPEPILLASMPGGLHTSDDFGTTWNLYEQAIPVANNWECMKVCNDGTLYITTKTGRVWRYDDLFTSVAGSQESIPTLFTVEPAYPNPFNGQTSISYTIPSPGSVTVLITNILGREVTRLNKQYSTSGTKQITWNTQGLNLSSGTYIVQLQHNGVSRIRKVVLMK